MLKMEDRELTVDFLVKIRRGITPLFFCLNTYKTTSTMKPSPRETQQAHQNYKKVSEHLIREGYAQDQESADDIIKGMSEEWFNLIIEE